MLHLIFNYFSFFNKRKPDKADEEQNSKQPRNTSENSEPLIITKDLDLPDEIWLEIAKFLQTEKLYHFKLVCKRFYNISQEKPLLNPIKSIYSRLYARLRKLDPTLSSSLPDENFIRIYKTAFSQVEDRQAEEFSSLEEKPPVSFMYPFGHDSYCCAYGECYSLSPLEILEKQNGWIEEKHRVPYGY